MYSLHSSLLCIQQGLVDCYLAMHRSREAVTIASNACKLLGQTPRALTVSIFQVFLTPVHLS